MDRDEFERVQRYVVGRFSGEDEQVEWWSGLSAVSPTRAASFGAGVVFYPAAVQREFQALGRITEFWVGSDRGTLNENSEGTTE